MKTAITFGISLWAIALWALGNATWILVLINLLWMFFKGGALFSWWIPGICGDLFIVLFIGFVMFYVWTRS